MNSREIKWSSDLAYAVGLITADGCLSKDGRHIELTSKDIEQLENFQKCLGIKVKIGWKTSGYNDQRHTRVQFGDVVLYRWLLSIGLKPNKSKTLGPLKIPNKYFFDFLRGYFDGDGSTYSYWDPRWKSSFMFYLQFVCGSKEYLNWLQKSIKSLAGVDGTIGRATRCYNLVYAKKASKEIIQHMYKNEKSIFLTRKRDKINNALQVEVAESVDALG
ncbi:hypothetical protein COZ22_02265 [bacterium (Candidatus Howlettbacteria) CG_4_10_14_3_um_filter_37_10]|nr:MAG: hypothetical protein COX25_02605 [bacterium (Candidatus Howlettbacteria) CG23_combo_of_CG06-09_8_20_14_all_37_9]PIX99567.1 MAG: hypothetical protein COZ22_02265 [bacterium (Candidatus Howlettbacteria) CG_4_10_14_3_um_filter_37_10]PJB06100.1 MAG: hypothetical protein CO123_02690 [bacterium (Candidatus Howlettbacteria) CG_4_9_14_3_um_filter_37_10]